MREMSLTHHCHRVLSWCAAYGTRCDPVDSFAFTILLAQRKLLKEMAIPIIVPKPFMTQFAEDMLIVVILVLEGCAIVCYRHW